MKKLIRKISFSSLLLMTTYGGAFAANANGLCALISEMQSVFKLLRTLAFVGAGFILAGWAWGFIKDGKGFKPDELKDKGTGMLVGFILLFAIGVIISVIYSTAGQGMLGCQKELFSGWN